MSEPSTLLWRLARADWLQVALVLLVGAVTLWFFAPAAGNDFVMFDDDINIYNNPVLGELTWARVQWAFTDNFYMPRYMPLGWISLVLIFQGGGLAPEAYHWVSILLHAVNAGLVMVVVWQGLRLAGRVRGLPTSGCWPLGLGVGAALVWAVHPLRVEPVSWATGLHYVHATFWALVTIAFAWARLEKTGRARSVRLVGAWVAYLLSVLVYPVTLGLPVALWIFERWLGGRDSAKRFEGGEESVCRWREHAPFVAIGALALLANVLMRLRVSGIFSSPPNLEGFSLFERALQGSYSALYYGWRPLIVGEVSPVYDQLYAGGGITGVKIVSLALVAVIFFSAAFAWWRRRSGWAAWCGAFIAVSVSYYGFLESPYQNCDRYTYFPSLALVFGLAVLGLAVPVGGARTVAGGSALAWWVWLAASVPPLMPVWRDNGRLFNRVAECLERADAVAWYQGRLAISMARGGELQSAVSKIEEMRSVGAPNFLVERTKSDVADVEREARGGLRLVPARGWAAPDALVSNQYALHASRAGEAWTARVRFERALKIDPGFHDARYNFAVWLAAQGEADAAWAHYAVLAGVKPVLLDSRLEAVLLRLIYNAACVTGALATRDQCSARLRAMGVGAEVMGLH